MCKHSIQSGVAPSYGNRRFSKCFPVLVAWRYMLEMLSRPYPRQQVLVTADPKLAEPGGPEGRPDPTRFDGDFEAFPGWVWLWDDFLFGFASRYVMITIKLV